MVMEVHLTENNVWKVEDIEHFMSCKEYLEVLSTLMH